MQLKYLNTLIQAQDSPAKILGISWSPNNTKLAVALADRTIALYDENGEKRDKFSLKPSDSKYGKKSFSVTSIAFSPDSTKIAVGQTDNIVYVYKIGEEWGDKKVICNKFIVSSAVTSLIWLAEGPLVFGTADGKVKLGNCKTNKSSTLYATESLVVALTPSFRGTGLLSGHADGNIIRFYVADDANMDSQGRIATHPTAPYALAWPLNHILAAGCDRKVILYDRDGKALRVFDYTKEDEKEFTVACSSPSGQAVVLGSFDRLRLYNWNSGKGSWEESASKEIKNAYTISALSWKRDGTRVACGTMCGGIFIFESVLKRTIWKNKYEMTYVGPNQVLVKAVNTTERGIILKSQFGHEIDDVRIMGRDRYIVARTLHTLLLGDLERNLLSEIMWSNSGRNEKFYFDNVNVCLIFNVGELSLVEYGENEILGSVRTEFMNPHLISVRINERRAVNSSEENKKLAYLLDLKTICIIDLVYGVTIAQINHDAKVDWLELNETGHKLLFRDKKQRLILLDPRLMRKESILTNCTFVQWVPGSDVVVAQSLNNLCVWYNIDIPERMTLFPIKGDVVEVIRSNGKTEVIVQEGVHQLGYELDEGLVEFGTAIHDNDFGRAILFLEDLGKRPEAEGMWQNLAGIAVGLNNLPVAERCFAALGDVSRTHFLRETIRIGEEFSKRNGAHILECPELWARIAILNKEIKTAEQIYLEQNEIDKALEMYQNFHKWEEALELARTKAHPDSDRLREKHMKWLMDSHQEEKAGSLKEREGDYIGAINLYLSGKQPGKAAKLLQNYSYLLEDDVANRVVSALIKADMNDMAGELYEKLNEPFKALEYYQKGKSFAKAIDLARKIAPGQIVHLEELWADSLVESRQLDAAINHYIEAGRTMKALDAAVNARQWKKAVQIIQVVNDTESVLKYYKKIGEYFESVKDYSTAEVMYLKGGLYKEAIDMYNNAGKWDKAHAIASNYFDGEEVSAMYLSQAQLLESTGKFKEAENLYVSIEKPDMAISMYKKHRQYDNMMRLVSIYHPDLVADTHGHLAQELEAGKQYKSAEYHYLMIGDWKSVVNMYRAADMWDDAYKIAKTKGGTEAGHQVAFVWARSLGGDAAVKLLNRFNILDLCIDYCCESYQFDFAFELAKLAKAEKLPAIHYKYALALEDDGKFEEAEEHFIKADKPKEAISMYIHMKMWDKAEQVAENHNKDSISEVLVLQAKDAVEKGNYSEIETLLLRAQKPEILIRHYQEADMWADALRVCREYLPSKLPALQNMYEKQTGNKGSRDVTSLITHARKFEQSGQYKQAIQTHLKISQSGAVDTETVMKSLLKAADITAKFADDSDEAIVISRTLGPRLIEVRQYGTAAQLYLSCGLIKEAVNAFLAGEDWAAARKTARDLDPSLESYVEERYKEYLANSGDVDQLADVDLLAALDLLVRQGQWNQCFETARQKGPQTLHKYVALYATQLIKAGNLTMAVNLYNKYDAPAFPQNYNIYKRICFEIMSTSVPEDEEEYEYWSNLRNMLYKVVENITGSNDSGSALHREFETLLRISHYYAARCAYRETNTLVPLATKISISLLRYTDIIPADKAFYEAGIDAKAADRENEAFVFLNHYLDICEAIEEENSELVDSSDFSSTDFPAEIPLPRVKLIDPVRHEEVKGWILAVSMDQKIDQTLPVDDRQLYESCLTCPTYTGTPALPCVVTGYPVAGGRNAVEFMKAGKIANQSDWNTLMMAVKTSVSSKLKDVISFISAWCGGIPSFTF